MIKTMKKEKVSDGLKLKGFFRVQIEDGPSKKIVGDSGWCENQVTNQGILLYLCDNLGGSAGSKQINYCAIGTGGAPAAAGTTLPGEVTSSTKRKAPTYADVSSTTAQFLVTFGSTDSFLGGSSDLSNVGLFATTDTNDTLFAGQTYATSACNTNQKVNVTYQIRFSTT